MTTPTPGKHVAATPPVSTPFSHLAAFSPRGPRSVVPSPQHVKKSPANSNTIYGHPTTSSFGAMNFDSPTAAAIGSLPPLGDLNLDAAALGLAGVNGGLHLGGRGDEDEKKRKLQQVIETLKVKKGRVSEEGIERLARKVGLECLWEDQMGSGGTVRTLIIAGTGLSLDIDFANNVVGKVALSFPDSSPNVEKHAEAAGKILLQDLQLSPNQSPLTKMLDKFSVNLERLAALDKLSVSPGLNCHEAIAGIYESLKRLHEWEVARLKEKEEMAGKSNDYITKAAMCTKSGRPVMNAHKNVGLSVDYWQEKHVRSQGVESSSEGIPKTWSLVIECAPSSAMVYPSVRVSDKWISSEIAKSNPTADDLLMATTGEVLDWQDPENILLPLENNKSEGQMEGIESDLNSANSKFPDVMFVAKFYPPLVVPYGIANQVYSSTGSTMDSFNLFTLDSLMFETSPTEKLQPDGSHRRLRRQTAIPVVSKDGQRSLRQHNNTLTIHKVEYGRTLTELPFSHPRQLVDMLPTLRQYASLSSLLETSFGTQTKEFPAEDEEEADPKQTIRDEFEAFMAMQDSKQNSHKSPDRLEIDVSLFTQPLPHLRLTFPFKNGTADIWFDIGMNGSLLVTSQNILEEGGKGNSSNGKTLAAQDLGRILEISEDFGVFAEYIKRRLE